VKGPAAHLLVQPVLFVQVYSLLALFCLGMPD